MPLKCGDRANFHKWFECKSSPKFEIMPHSKQDLHRASTERDLIKVVLIVGMNRIQGKSVVLGIGQSEIGKTETKIKLNNCRWLCDNVPQIERQRANPNILALNKASLCLCVEIRRPIMWRWWRSGAIIIHRILRKNIPDIHMSIGNFEVEPSRQLSGNLESRIEHGSRC